MMYKGGAIADPAFNHCIMLFNRLFLDLPPESYKTDYARGARKMVAGSG